VGRFVFAVAALAALASCTSAPATRISLSTTGLGLERGPDDSFAGLTATANGIDCGPPRIFPGRRGNWDTPDTNASASFAFPTDVLGADTLEIVVFEGGTRYATRVETLAEPRAVALAAALDQPLRPGDWVEATTGVATDRMQGNGIGGSIAGASCFYLPAAGRDLGTSMRVQMPPTLDDGAWMFACGTPAAPGTLVAITLVIGLAPSTPATACEGPDLACGNATLPIVSAQIPVTIQM
jgi:hypothetical protein